MADPASYGNPDRDIEQALFALKKGSQLVKYCRKGKPKLRSFRVSPDETTLIWYSHGAEKDLRLSSVSRIQLGQRTAVFKRYPRPEKDYLSFSLIYNNGDRSLDLICKDQAELEVWLSGLKSLIFTGERSRHTRDIFDLHDGSGSEASLDFAGSLTLGRPSIDLCSDVGYANMQLRTSGGDGFRISVSSTPSCSSQGSNPDDIESLGDVYIWGEVWCDSSLPEGSTTAPIKSDVLVPKPLESNVVLDVQQIACGVHHIALVTRQGEVFTWGEECGGRLGHGVEKNFAHPKLVEFLAVTNIEFVACGEYHTCAVSVCGNLYTWGDGSHNAGLLGQGSDVSHWIPKLVSGPLEEIQVSSVSCGTWHSALTTVNGKLFTFGDGSFGALGHGDRESVPVPREIQPLNGLKTMKVACGVWHTAAIVEFTNQYSSANRKLFTWGDGNKNQLGHGNKDTYLLPTCVSTLIDYNFTQIGCGNSVTVGLTTSGHVFTMGSTAYGQLGNPQSEGKLPCLVQDRLYGEFVEEISCGSYHIAAITSKSELFTWGSGANGKLGHGDTEDRNTPSLVESLRDRHVKSVSCGSSYTSAICIHKWISGADQSVCSGCRQAFGFTRKRHNCYNCGLVHCHACSSKKALRAALAPAPGKPHRVCDSCYAKLRKGVEAPNPSNLSRKAVGPTCPIDGGIRSDRRKMRNSRILLSPITEPIKYLEVKTAKLGTTADYSILRASQVPSFLQLKDIAFPSSLSVLQNALKPNYVQTIQQPPPPPQPPTSSTRSVSPYTRRPSPPRSATPQFSRGVIDSLKKTNDLLNQEVSKLQNQVKSLKHKTDSQDLEMKKLEKTTQEAACLAAEKSSKCSAAFEVVKCLTTQLNEVKEKFPPELCDSESFKAINAQAESLLSNSGTEDSFPQELLSDQKYFLQKSASVLGSNNQQYHSSEESASSQDSTHNACGTRDSTPQQSTGYSSMRTLSRSEGAKEMMEQFEPGVYVTVLQFPSGAKLFKRVRFSKRRFAEQQAEEWWKENKDRLLKKYSSTSSRPTGSSQADQNTPPVAAEDTS